MKKTFLLALLAVFGIAACGQKVNKNTPEVASENTLLWRVSGNGLTKPSYLFGTMHIICASDIEVSDSLKAAIKNSDDVYLEIAMDNLFEMLFGALGSLSMKGDTTLADLLSPEDYQKVKNHIEQATNGMMPFSALERFKPFFLSAMLSEMASGCESPVSMEALVMETAKENQKDIKGLETMEYQLSIFDSIPYKVQAEQLVKMVEQGSSPDDENDMKMLTEAYRNQELNRLDEFMKKDPSVKEFSELLLYRRNMNWANKLPQLMADKSLVVAVGAGHLPGERGVINLLRKAGYKVEPVPNNMIRKKTKQL